MMRWILLLAGLVLGGQALAADITVGSKADREGHMLGELFAQTLEHAGFTVDRRFGLGQTIVSWQALKGGEIDVYPEYTGTMAQALFDMPGADIETLRREAERRGVRILKPLGFNNTYALTMKASEARAMGLETISDLATAPSLKLGLSHEFIEREDGWKGLSRAYNLPQVPVGIEHGIAYQAIVDNRIDMTDAYSTDGDLDRLDLMLLKDDRHYFPEYLAVPFVRATLPDKAVDALDQLAGSITDQRMQAMNAAVSADGAGFGQVAHDFLVKQGILEAGSEVAVSTPWSRLGHDLVRHLELTLSALLLAALVGLPLSLAVYRLPKLSRTVLYVAGLLQTIPSIALLALMIPLFGIGVFPAIVALFLYSLLPIVRAAITALLTVDPLLTRVARGMGLTRREQLRHVILPLAAPNLLTGLKTAAVINIGTATLAAFIGAGGLGDPIVTGLSLNNYELVLYGAIPAAMLAIVTELIFEMLERWLIPAHMRGQVATPDNRA
ncbi:glycine betaine ABC transporter substrate-binding protein [Larsenimonas rhizosphaerae]|uniref:ABC transporter permease subunit n=1 Tax=Larsenimonas rhizosphaerae TaxID=2944682 RepID=A0AA41ZE26_9GAMM|nr:glycine betaine ABC transporter substrate-binding protein [Larsenimonas rhizosphaerae]MCM2130880.1 ABC transporter permease subunit [Larsenimonas rhizosphaerae]MCX2523584.1 ABC transporter permease subunit [Larsenimonas rhizosphaerae]